MGSMAWSTSLLATGSRCACRAVAARSLAISWPRRRDHTILKRDDRDPRQHVGVLAAHRQEVSCVGCYVNAAGNRRVTGAALARRCVVCSGLAMNGCLRRAGMTTGYVCALAQLRRATDRCGMAQLLVWDVAGAGGGAAGPLCRFTDHTAAVKALAWSPHQHGASARAMRIPRQPDSGLSVRVRVCMQGCWPPVEARRTVPSGSGTCTRARW